MTDLSPEQIDAYRQDGVICIRQLYSPEWVGRIRDFLDEIIANPSPLFGPRDPNASQHQDLSTWLTNDDVRDFVLQGPSARVAQQVFGSQRVSFYSDQIFVKEKLSPDPTPWHHDGTFWPIAGDQIASIWTSVDAIDAASSALEFVAGSHRWGKNYQAVGLDGIDVSPQGEILDEIPDINAHRGDYDIKSWTLEPGDALLFHSRILHGARGNQSANQKRRAITTRWCGDDATFVASRGGQLWDANLEDGQPFCSSLYPQVLPHIIDEQIARRMAGPILPDESVAQKLGAMIAGAKRHKVEPDPEVLAKIQ